MVKSVLWSVRYMLWYLKEELTYALLWLVRKLNRDKNRILAATLLDMSSDYDYPDPILRRESVSD